MEVRNKSYWHCVVEGTPYEAGKYLGDMFKNDKGFIRFMASPFMGGNKLSEYKVKKVMELYDKYCPGVNEEIKGFADCVGCDAGDIVYYHAYVQNMTGNCSHMVVNPLVTADGHIYLARSYEFDWDDKPILCTSRVNGQYGHIGFACHLFGRFDGMNEKGLCITTSSGVIGANITDEGFVFLAVVRSVLSRCESVDEALELLLSMPISDYRNLLLADKQGEAALVEAASDKKAVKRIKNVSADKYLCSTNHYTITEGDSCLYSTDHYTISNMIEYDVGRMAHSVLRYKAIKSKIEAAIPTVTKDTLRDILSNTVPDGVCCHHYKEGMGTIWSMIFNPIDGNVEICFGSPAKNSWRTFGTDSIKSND